MTRNELMALVRKMVYLQNHLRSPYENFGTFALLSQEMKKDPQWEDVVLTWDGWCFGLESNGDLFMRKMMVAKDED